MKLNINVKYNKNELIASKMLFRKGERDLLTKEIIESIDSDGFVFDFEDFNKLHFDNSGRYFENPKNSYLQIQNVISDILEGKEINPVIIDTKGNVLDGQHRMCAFKILNIKNIPVLKSLMNDTVFDNLTVRKIKLNIPFEDDFFTKNDLEKNPHYQRFKSHETINYLKNITQNKNKIKNNI
jgi:hypothetical protein